MRTLTKAAAALAALTLLTACGGDSGENAAVGSLAGDVPTAEEIDGTIDTAKVKKSIVVGVDNQHYIFHNDIVVAREMGYFKEFGIDEVDVKTIDNPVPGLIGGSVDFANYDVDGEIASAAKANTNMRFLAVTFGGETATLGVREGINTPEDLKGKILSPGQFNTRNEQNMRELLEANGLNPDTDVQIVETGGNTNERLQAIIAGTIDGGNVQLRHRQMLEAAGGKILLEVSRQVPNNGWSADRVLSDSPETAPAFLAAILKAREYVTDPANKDAVLKLMADNGFEIPEDFAAAYEEENAPDYHTVDGGFEIADMDKFIADAEALNVVPAGTDWRKWTDLLPLWRAQKAVGMELRPNPADFQTAK